MQIQCTRAEPRASIDPELAIARYQMLESATEWGAFRFLNSRERDILFAHILNADVDGVVTITNQAVAAAIGLNGIPSSISPHRRRLVDLGLLHVLAEPAGLARVYRVAFAGNAARHGLAGTAGVLAAAQAVLRSTRRLVMPMPLWRKVAVVLAAAGASVELDHDRGVATFLPEAE